MKLYLKNFSLYKTDSKDELLFESTDYIFSSGKLNVIYGQSGSGKTTFLNAICRMNNSYNGEIFLDDKLLNSSDIDFKDDFSYVTSDQCYIEELSIIDQLRLVSSDEDKIDDILKSFNLTQVSDKKAIKCSTGEQVRCSIATAILKNTKVLLLDEPTANLDKSNKKMVFELLSEYAKSHLVIVSTHDIDYIEDDYNTYKIEDNKLICEKQVESTTQEYINTNAKNIKNDFLISLKLGFKNAFKHKITFAFSFVFLCLFLISIFAMISFGLLNERRTKVAAVNSAISGETSYFTLNDISLDNLNSITEPHFYSTYGLCGYEETDDSGNIVTKYTSFNIACLEDLNEETQKIYRPYFDNYTYDDANTFPLVTNEDYLKQFLNNISDSHNPIPSIASLKVGDTLKITFKSCSASSKTYHVTSNQSQDFKIAGIISSEEQKKVHEFYETSSTLTEDFPCIIRRKDYISYLRKHGIRCWNINDTISSILEKYDIYCEKNGLKSTLYSYKDPVTGEKDYNLTNFTTLLKYSDYQDKYVDTSITPIPSDYDDKIYYIGNLPKESNWMLLPYNTRNDLKELVSRIIYDDDFDTWEDKAFFEQYLNGKTLEYPLSDNNYPSLLNSNIESSVVFCGVFNLNSKDVHMNDCVIVSDALYDKLIASIDKGNKEGYIKNLYVTNEYIKNHFDEIVDGNSAISIPILEKCSITINGLIYGKTFLMVVTIITCVLSVLVSLVYVINTLKSLNHSFAVSQLLGKDNKWRILLYLYSLLPVLLLSFIVALSTSQVITNSCIKTVYQSTTSNSDYSFIRYLAIPYSLSYLLQFIALIGFTIFAMSISFIRRKKNAFRKIKENE